MKIPTLDTTKSIVLGGAVLLLAYAAWRAYKTGSSIANVVGDSIEKVTDAVRVGADNVSIAASGVRTSLGGAAPSSPEDQSQAETERLARQNGPETGWLGDAIRTPKASDDDYNPPQVDPMGNVIGLFTPTLNYAQLDSPDAAGLAS